MRKGVMVWALVAAGAWVGLTRAADEPKAEKVVTDQQFVQLASAAGLAEVNVSGLAKTNAKSEAVKKFAQRMIQDHSKANQELNKVADKHGIAPAQQADAQHQAIFNRLSRLQGEQFDKEFIKVMVQDHETAVSLFQGEANHGKVKDLKSLADKTLPTLKEHLKMAKDMAK